jgi:hypothetical protein
LNPGPLEEELGIELTFGAFFHKVHGLMQIGSVGQRQRIGLILPGHAEPVIQTVTVGIMIGQFRK